MLSTLAVAAAMMIANDPDGVVSTAPSGADAVLVGAVAPTAPDVPTASAQAITPHGLSTDEQIDRWISQRSEVERPFADAGSPWLEDDRKMHSEFSAEIGTGDYSAYSAAVSIPIGSSGRVNLSYSRSENGYGYGYGGYRNGYGYGPGGFGPGGFGSTGRDYRDGWRRGTPSLFERGVVYPGSSIGYGVRDDGPGAVQTAPGTRSVAPTDGGSPEITTED